MKLSGPGVVHAGSCLTAFQISSLSEGTSNSRRSEEGVISCERSSVQFPDAQKLVEVRKGGKCHVSVAGEHAVVGV